MPLIERIITDQLACDVVSGVDSNAMKVKEQSAIRDPKSRVLIQLRHLSEHLTKVFDDLEYDLSNFDFRIKHLSKRVSMETSYANTENVTSEIASEAAIDSSVCMISDGVSSNAQRHQPYFMQTRLAAQYFRESQQRVPILHRLDSLLCAGNDENRDACSKGFSDPSLFFIKWRRQQESYLEEMQAERTVRRLEKEERKILELKSKEEARLKRRSSDIPEIIEWKNGVPSRKKQLERIDEDDTVDLKNDSICEQDEISSDVLVPNSSLRVVTGTQIDDESSTPPTPSDEHEHGHEHVLTTEITTESTTESTRENTRESAIENSDSGLDEIKFRYAMSSPTTLPTVPPLKPPKRQAPPKPQKQPGYTQTVITQTVTQIQTVAQTGIQTVKSVSDSTIEINSTSDSTSTVISGIKDNVRPPAPPPPPPPPPPPSPLSGPESNNVGNVIGSRDLQFSPLASPILSPIKPSQINKLSMLPATTHTARPISRKLRPESIDLRRSQSKLNQEQLRLSHRSIERERDSTKNTINKNIQSTSSHTLSHTLTPSTPSDSYLLPDQINTTRPTIPTHMDRSSIFEAIRNRGENSLLKVNQKK